MVLAEAAAAAAGAEAAVEEAPETDEGSTGAFIDTMADDIEASSAASSAVTKLEHGDAIEQGRRSKFQN